MRTVVLCLHTSLLFLKLLVHRQRALYNVLIINPAEAQSFVIMYKSNWLDPIWSFLSMHCVYGFVHVFLKARVSHWAEVIAVWLVKSSQDTTCCCLKIPSPALCCFAMNTIHFSTKSLLPFYLHSLHISATSEWESKIHMHGCLIFLTCHTFLSQQMSATGVSEEHLAWITHITLEEAKTLHWSQLVYSWNVGREKDQLSHYIVLPVSPICNTSAVAH